MLSYTEEQAKKDAVVIWQALYDKLKEIEITDDIFAKFRLYGITELKKMALREDYPDLFSLLAKCSYCHHASQFRYFELQDCKECIGVKNGAFGGDAEGNYTCCRRENPYYKLMDYMTTSDVDSVDVYKKTSLKLIKQLLDKFIEINNKVK